MSSGKPFALSFFKDDSSSENIASINEFTKFNVGSEHLIAFVMMSFIICLLISSIAT